MKTTTTKITSSESTTLWQANQSATVVSE